MAIRASKGRRMTKKETAFLEELGVSVDEHGRVKIRVGLGREAIVSTWHHEVFVMSSASSNETLLSVHSHFKKPIHVVPERPRDPTIALGRIMERPTPTTGDASGAD